MSGADWKDLDQDQPADPRPRTTSGCATPTPANHDCSISTRNSHWAWAVIEVFRHTGVRVEELLELSHHSLIQYRLPSTVELMTLLQIAPSKTDAERLLPID